ncbi:hypothetical protein M9978_16410 [Sphingomonas sp. MG17]|uniref:Uncharacterized protein n=1 Tax=Sphingomonas tagetis TaxID=2949092 RepID=A0A9X2KLY0_9SPHN|nr:hypothetical protein [Sphingomonas tagetis]MCP3732009.1 hypothetical protein [Sphingomonas tagetis]
MAGLDLIFDIDLDQIAGVRDDLTRSHLRAAKDAVADTTKWLERELEAITRGAVPGRLWRAWASNVYPREKGKIARDPAGEVYVNGRDRTVGAMTFWSKPGRIVGKRGQWLAIPSAAVPRRGRKRQPLTPVEVEAEFNKELIFLPPGRGSKYASLVLEGVTNGRTGAFRPRTRQRVAADRRRGIERHLERILMFTLIPFVAHRNAFAVEPVVFRAGRRLTDEYVARAGRIR